MQLSSDSNTVAPVIRLNSLTRRFRTDRGEITAVDRLSLSTQSGEVYGLLGPNGAGKTTTLRMLLGLLAPSEGDVEIMGTRISEDQQKIRQKVGLVSASAGLYQWLTPLEILKYFATGYAMTKSQATQRIEELTALMGLSSFLHRRTAALSTGQKQRVNLARALVHDPPVVLLDEPTRGLDVVGSQIVFDFVATLRGAGKAVIVCTHQLDEAQRLCDRFGLLHHGRLRHEGTMTELQQQTGLRISLWTQQWVFTWKELCETLRDRRTTVTLIVMPVLLYPLLGLMFRFVAVGEASKLSPEYRIAMETEQEASWLSSLIQSGNEMLQHASQPSAGNGKDSAAEAKIQFWFRMMGLSSIWKRRRLKARLILVFA